MNECILQIKAMKY